MNERLHRPRDPAGSPATPEAVTARSRPAGRRLDAAPRRWVRRLAIGRWLDWTQDRLALAGVLCLALAGLLWLLDHGSAAPLPLPLDIPFGAIGTALLSGRLAWRYARLQAAHVSVLQAASARMSRATTVEGVGRTIVEETGRIIDYHNARVYVLEGRDVVPIAFEGRVGAYEQVDLDLLRTRLGEGFTGWVAEHGVPLLVNDANQDPRGATIPGTDEVDESMLVVPMRYDERTVGVITLSKLGLDQFTPADLRLLSILADQAATALESARLLARSQSLAAELRRLVDMARALSQSLDPYQVAELIARHLAQAAGVERCKVSYLDQPAGLLWTMASHPDGLATRHETFELADYPETRRVLDQQVAASIDGADDAADQAERRLLASEGLRSMVMLPLVAKGTSVGLAELTATSPMRLEPSTLELLTTMASEAAMALENAVLYDRARTLADRDPVTGFYNHRYLHQRLGEEVLRASRSHRPLSLLMLDLDDFKLVNDTFGHMLGDGVLAWTAQLIRSTLRASDVPARYGGDEFAVLLPDADRDGALATAERILAAFRERPFQAEQRGPVPISVSIGVATYPSDALGGTALLEASDVALYRAKRAGGDRVAVGSEPRAVSESPDTGKPRAGAGTGRRAKARDASEPPALGPDPGVVAPTTVV